MTLLAKTWRRVSPHAVVAEWLKGEHGRLRPGTPEAAAELSRLIAAPDLASPLQNHRRLRALLSIRRQVLGEIPPDARWYEVRSLTDAELPQLRVIANASWTDAGGNELAAMAAAHPEPLTRPPTEWPRPILFGHGRVGPFTILEGNRRLAAYAAAGPDGTLDLPAFVGLSPTPCYFHAPDDCGFVANDMWR